MPDLAAVCDVTGYYGLLRTLITPYHGITAEKPRQHPEGRRSTLMRKADTENSEGVGSIRGTSQHFDAASNPTDLGTFYRKHPEFIWAPAVVAAGAYAVCTLTQMAERLAEAALWQWRRFGRPAQKA